MSNGGWAEAWRSVAEGWRKSSDGWREAALTQQGRAEDLEHELGQVREVLRRVIGYVDSVRHLIVPKESEPR